MGYHPVLEINRIYSPKIIPNSLNIYEMRESVTSWIYMSEKYWLEILPYCMKHIDPLGSSFKSVFSTVCIIQFLICVSHLISMSKAWHRSHIRWMIWSHIQWIILNLVSSCWHLCVLHMAFIYNKKALIMPLGKLMKLVTTLEDCCMSYRIWI